MVRSLSVTVQPLTKLLPLIVIGPGVAEDELHGAWFYMPRMLHENSTILSEKHAADGQVSFNSITRTQIAERAARESMRRAA